MWLFVDWMRRCSRTDFALPDELFAILFVLFSPSYLLGFPRYRRFVAFHAITSLDLSKSFDVSVKRNKE